MRSLVPMEIVERRILMVRGEKVLLSFDLAVLYDVPPRVLVQAVKRNRDRFPADFMFQLNRAELSNLKSQSVISSWGGRRVAPYAFTEQGVAMLSSVLNSRRAIGVNISIMRTFVKLRAMLAAHRDLARRLDELEARFEGRFRQVFEAIRALMSPPAARRRRIGFHVK